MMRHLAGLFLALALAATAFAAQTSTSHISGAIRDSSAAVIAGAEVTLISEATGLVQKQPTTGAGVYAFPSIPVGSYTLRVEAIGFKTVVRSGISVQVNTPTTLDFTLELGSITETVEVVTTTEILQTSSATLSNVISQQAIVTLPLNGRNPLALLMYEPGVVLRPDRERQRRSRVGCQCDH